MGQTIKVDEGQGYYETDYTPYECGAKQRRAIDTIVDLYNEGKDEARRVRWDEADEDFIDPDAGRWRPYLLQTWHRDLIATFETTSDLIALLKSLDVDAAREDLEIKVDDSWWKTWFSWGEPEA